MAFTAIAVLGIVRLTVYENSEVDMKQFIEKYNIWFPLLALAFFDVIALCLYPATAEEVKPIVFLEIIGVFLGFTAITLTAKFTPVKIPVYLIAEASLSAVLAVNLGTAFNIYEAVPCWDLILHGYFGIWCAQAVWLLLRLEKPVMRYIISFVCVMGIAALWEVFEFSSDIILGGDAQRVQESLALGINPISDTMTDIIIAAVGYAVFAGGNIAYRLSGRHGDRLGGTMGHK